MKKILIGFIAVLGIAAFNVLPIEDVKADGFERAREWRIISRLCPDGVGYQKYCEFVPSGGANCIQGTSFPITCSTPVD